MLKSSERNRKKYYRINPHFSILHELTSVIRKTDESNQLLLRRLSKLGDVDILILTGTFLDKKADVDLFLIGNVKKSDLERFIHEAFPDNIVKYSLMTREDFLYRVTLKDKFVVNVFRDKDNLILKNKLKKDTEPLVSL